MMGCKQNRCPQSGLCCFTAVSSASIGGFVRATGGQCSTALPDVYTGVGQVSEVELLLTIIFVFALMHEQAGVELQDQEITEIRDILLVLIIAAEHYSLQVCVKGRGEHVTLAMGLHACLAACPLLPCHCCVMSLRG
eukprot:1158163-Pelagomonas_calceolata.AAC.2